MARRTTVADVSKRVDDMQAILEAIAAKVGVGTTAGGEASEAGDTGRIAQDPRVLLPWDGEYEVVLVRNGEAVARTPLTCRVTGKGNAGLEARVASEPGSDAGVYDLRIGVWPAHEHRTRIVGIADSVKAKALAGKAGK